MSRIAQRASCITSSVTLEITAKAKKMRQEGVDVIGFGAGEPDFDTPAHIKAAAIKAIHDGFTKYTPSSGTLELREAISKKFKADNSIDYKPSQIVVSSGAKHSLNNIFQAMEGLKREGSDLSREAAISRDQGPAAFTTILDLYSWVSPLSRSVAIIPATAPLPFSNWPAST